MPLCPVAQLKANAKCGRMAQASGYKASSFPRICRTCRIGWLGAATPPVADIIAVILTSGLSSAAGSDEGPVVAAHLPRPVWIGLVALVASLVLRLPQHCGSRAIYSYTDLLLSRRKLI